MLNDKLTIKDIIFFVIIILIVIGCVVGKIQTDKAKTLEEQKQMANMVVGIHIKGEVKNEGYYELPYGSRVKDAIKKAGGETALSDISSVNLAQKLTDGEEIIIPAKSTDKKTSSNKNLININTAGVKELCTLEGIGESTANEIIAYRNKHGNFKNIKDLTKITGIGSSKFLKIKENITIG